MKKHTAAFRNTLAEVQTIGLVVGGIIGFVLGAAVPVLADEAPAPSWFEHVDLMQVTIVALLAYAAWTLKRYLGRIDSIANHVEISSQVLTVMATEHIKNHGESALKNIDLMKLGAGN